MQCKCKTKEQINQESSNLNTVCRIITKSSWTQLTWEVETKKKVSQSDHEKLENESRTEINLPNIFNQCFQGRAYKWRSNNTEIILELFSHWGNKRQNSHKDKVRIL